MNTFSCAYWLLVYLDLWNGPSNILPTLKIGLSSYYRIGRVVYILWIPVPCTYMFCKYFLPMSSLPIHFLIVSFEKQISYSDEIYFLFFMVSVFWVLTKIFPTYTSRNFTVVASTFRAMIHFELSFVYGMRYGSRLIFSHIYREHSSTNCWKAFFSFLTH